MNSRFRAPTEAASFFLCKFLYLQKLRTSWSKRLGDLAKDIFLTSVPAQTKLSAEHCEKLWLDLEQELSAQLQQAACTTKQQLEDIRAELDKDGQVENTWGSQFHCIKLGGFVCLFFCFFFWYFILIVSH